MPESLELEEVYIYFVINKKSKKIVYIGESENGRTRVQSYRFDKKVCDIKVIKSNKIKCLNNYYFRRYYEARWIYKFKPEYNRQIITPPTLNYFLIKMFYGMKPSTKLDSTFHKIVHSSVSFYLTHKNKNKYIYNGYTKVWDQVDTNKKLFINGEKAFDYILNNKIEKTLGTKTRKTFRTRTEKLHN